MKLNCLVPAAALVQKEQGLETPCRAKGCSGNEDLHLEFKTSKSNSLTQISQVTLFLPSANFPPAEPLHLKTIIKSPQPFLISSYLSSLGLFLSRQRYCKCRKIH